MQPVYQIPGEMLEAHIARLCVNETFRSTPTLLHALLFLSGLRAAFLPWNSSIK